MKHYWHEKTVEFPLYSGNLKIILTNSKSKVAKKMNDEHFHYATTYYRSMDDRRTSCIVLNFGTDPLMTHGTIAHESTHAADFLFEAVGAKHHFDNPEPYSYLVGWIANEVYEFIYENNLELKTNKDKWINNPKSNPSIDS